MILFCIYHGRPVEREDGYMVLPCKKHLKVCGFKIDGAYYCPDVEFFQNEVGLPNKLEEICKKVLDNANSLSPVDELMGDKEDCHDGKCRLS